ncbi:MAG: efflux RND transporter periplasmic adaptor subunit [Acidobacteriaceae bacterium]
MIRALLRSRTIALSVAIASAALLFAAAGCSSGDNSADATPVVRVETVVARRQAIDNVVTSQGLVYPIHQASIAPKITAPVERFYVNRGSRVHAGQLLATLANQDLAASLVSARGSYDSALANYQSTTASTLPEEIQTAENNLQNAKSNLDQQQRLYDSESRLYKEGAIARNILDATGVALTSAKSAYQNAEKHLHDLKSTGETAQQRAAKGQLETARGQFLNAQAQLAYTQIRSPINGVIADRSVYPGDVPPAGTPLFIVVDASRIIVRLHIPQPQAAQLELGDPASILIPGTSNTLPAKVTVISPTLDPSSTTVEVWVEAANPHNALQPGSSVSVTITARKTLNAVVVPIAALLTNSAGKSHVMVVDSNSVASSQSVVTGVEQGNLVQIVSGLEPGQQVIVTGAYGLPDKTKVKPTPVSFQAALTPSDSAQ